MSPLAPVRYKVRFPRPQSHYAEVKARFPTDGRRELDLFLPVWTPGSYMVREFSRNIESFTATGTSRLTVTKIRKNRWRVRIPEAIDEITVNYSLYCHELSVRTNYLDETFALLNGAATFLTLLESPSREHQVILEPFAAWQGSWSGLPGETNHFQAADYDMLVDSPIVAGNPAVYRFDVDGKPHFLLNIGESGLWDGEKSVEDLQRIVCCHQAMWGSLPYDRYCFFNLLTGSRGGLEHRNSVVMMADRFATRTRASYTDWLDLVSHEFFHVWNVKRLRPAELGPFDYENEVYTRNLWVAEGFTEYYGLLAMRRAGLTSDAEFLGSNGDAEHDKTGSLSGLIQKLESTPGRFVQSVSLASFDAWIKLYRPDENSVNAAMSYYTKGAVIAWLLDATIRSSTDDRKSLDDVMRLAHQHFGGDRGFSTREFHSLCQEVAGRNLNEWFTHVTESTEELDYSQALDWFGLRFKSAANASPKAWTGLTTRRDREQLIVKQVLRGSPAWEAGVSAGDEILGIDNFRVHPEQWEERMDQYYPGEEISLLVSRRDHLTTITIRLEKEPVNCWLLEVDPESDMVRSQHLLRWLSM